MADPLLRAREKKRERVRVKENRMADPLPREGKENAHGRRWEKKKREGEENILLRYKV